MRDLGPLYRCIRQNLLQRRDHVSRIVGGAACEQWFSSEAFVALNWPAEPVLASGHCAQAEHRKRDLIVRDGSRVVGTVESKVVYNNKNLWSAMAELQRQVERECYDDETAECTRGGLMYFVWCDYFKRREVRGRAEFEKVVLSEVDRLFPKSKFVHIPSDALDVIVQPIELPWPGHAYQVALYTKFVQPLGRPEEARP